MSEFDLEAIRARDTEDVSTLPMLKTLAVAVDDPELRTVIHMVEDRSALLRYVDDLRAAAGKMTCRRCNGHGDLLQPDTVPPGWRTDPCPDCGPLRALLAKEGEPNV